MKKALMVVGRGVEQFLTDGMMDELSKGVDLTVRNNERFDEDVYLNLVRETQAEILITGWNSPLLTSEIVAQNPQLKYMCNLTGSVRSMVARDVVAQGLLVSNWGNLIGPTVAEAALMAMLSCLRRTVRVAFLMHHEKGWRGSGPKDVESLFYQKVGLHGFGNIAQILVKLLAPFECDISAYDPYAKDEVFERLGVKRVSDLKTLYANNKIVSIHAPKTDETYHIVNAEMLATMADGSILVNTARGALIDTDALILELKTGRLLASLDVYEQEPLPSESALRGLLNCQLSPHTGGPTPDRMVDFGRAAIENIARYQTGEAVLHKVDVQTYDLIT
ncbi:MAG: hydroxyacid dehydrogenase [Candidatus Latescibacteria bacterium]|nr:hydroxyacid dehydrogenase [Candidatus Latescibacterota bacterium]